MPIEVYPHSKFDRVIVYLFRDPWTWNELLFAHQRECHYGKIFEPDHYITLLLMQNAKSMAPGLNLSHFKYLQENNPKNWERLVVVRDPTHFFNPLFALDNQFPTWSDYVSLVDTVEEAEQFISQMRPAWV